MALPESLVLPGLAVLLELPAHSAQRAPPELLGLQELPERLVRLVRPALEVLRAVSVHRALRVTQVQSAPPVLKGRED